MRFVSPAPARPAPPRPSLRVLALLLTLASGSARPAAATPRAVEPFATPLVLRDCVLSGYAGRARCGEQLVREDRATAQGRRIALRVVVLPATDGAAEPDPVVLLAGGPGQAASELAALVAAELATVHRRRDLVLVDQRGTGGSNALGCTGGMALVLVPDPAATRRCVAALADRADVRHYTTTAAADDLDDVRAALGYERLNLVGVSYGTRVAQVYARRHPARVRTLTLRAVAPLGFNILRDGARTAQAALTRLVADCAADVACAAAHPAFGAELDTVLAHVAREPVVARVAGPGGRDSADVRLDAALVAQTLYALQLSATTRQQIPLLVNAAASRGPAALAPVTAQVSAALYGPIPVGQYLSVVCAEDASRLSGAARAAIARSGYFGATASIVETCRDWPHTPVSADFHRPVEWSGPALLLSGELDPATDAAQASALAARWPNARHVVLPATAHGPMLPGCARALVHAFIEQASAAGLDDRCLAALALPPFAVAAPR